MVPNQRLASGIGNGCRRLMKSAGSSPVSNRNWAAWFSLDR
jgi:hypothetical protein